MREMSLREMQEKYAEIKAVTEGMDVPGVGGAMPGAMGGAGDMGIAGGAAGAIMPPPAIAPPVPPAGGIPGAAGDAALSPPPEVPEEEPEEDEEGDGRSPAEILKALREGIMQLEILLRENGLLEPTDEEE